MQGYPLVLDPLHLAYPLPIICVSAVCTVLTLVRGCPIAKGFAHFLGRSAHLYHGFTRFSSARPHASGVREGIRDSEGYWNAVGFWGGASNTHTSVPYWPAQVRCFGHHPRTQRIVFGILQFRHPHCRHPKTPLLAYKEQNYGCLGRHPRTPTIFCGIVQFKHPPILLA